MLSLRRTPTSRRMIQDLHLLVSRDWTAKSDASCWLYIEKEHHNRNLPVGQTPVSSTEVHPCRISVCRRVYDGIRYLSSQATSNSKDNYGFSDLDNPPESEKAGVDTDEKDFDDLGSELELSDDDSDVDTEKVVDASAGLSEAEDISNDVKIGVEIPIFQIIMDSQRNAVGKALDKWVEEGNQLGREEVTMAMLYLRKRRLYYKALQLIEWLETNKHIQFVERDYASHLDLIAKVHGLQKAEKFIDSVPESFRGEVLYRTLLANCVAAGYVKKTEEVFKKMRELGLPLTVFSCDQLLLLYKRADRKKLADILLLMEKENIKPSLFTYRLLIDTKGRYKDIAGMEQILEAMKSDGLEPDDFTKATMVQHYLYGGSKEKAEALLKELEGDNISDNRDACKYLLRLYAALGKADDVRRVWKVCESSTPRLDECLAAIEAWGMLGRIEDAEEVFEDTLKSRKKLPARHYNTLLKLYANHKLLSKGKAFTKRMAVSRCHVGPLTWDALVRLYVECGEVEKADSLLEKGPRKYKSSKPLHGSFMMVLEQYATRGDVRSTERIFQKIRHADYSLKPRHYQILLQAYINSKTPAYGIRERMKADNIYPNKQLSDQLAAADPFKRSQLSDLLD